MCNPILVTLIKIQPHNSQISGENATPSSGTYPIAHYKEVPPPLPPELSVLDCIKWNETEFALGEIILKDKFTQFADERSCIAKAT